jgi:hypothetical protein
MLSVKKGGGIAPYAHNIPHYLIRGNLIFFNFTGSAFCVAAVYFGGVAVSARARTAQPPPSRNAALPTISVKKTY